jgi:hypothetical protein
MACGSLMAAICPTLLLVADKGWLFPVPGLGSGGALRTRRTRGRSPSRSVLQFVPLETRLTMRFVALLFLPLRARGRPV